MLIKAVDMGDKQLYQNALELGGDPTFAIPVEESDVGWTTHCLLTLAARRGHAQMVPLLVDAGLKVEGSGKTSVPPLHRAARHGHHQVLAALLEAGANPHVIDAEGQ